MSLQISQRKETQRLLLERLSRSGVQVDMSTVNRSIEEAERLSSAIRDRIRAVQVRQWRSALPRARALRGPTGRSWAPGCVA